MKQFAILFSVLLVFGCNQSKKSWHFDKGMAHGTFYSITYQAEKNVQEEIEQVIKRTDQSLSTYQPTSVISRINSGDTLVVLDSLFIDVFDKGLEIWAATYGAFDMTVAPLVNAWGFGYEKGFISPQKSIDSIMVFVGFEKVKRIEKKIVKEYPGIKLDASAIAKGYSVDRVARFLESKGIANYMVEIGGEVRVKGTNPKESKWRIGIDKPYESPLVTEERDIQEVININHGSIATSGNYRQFYIKDGKKIAHTINPKTGYPVQHDLLSVTVWAPDCMTADAYATAFMVLGYQISRAIVEKTDSLEAYFIIAVDEEKYAIEFTEGIKSMLQ
jgi:thiamine biosynthesis lipoprotein